jgi:hypothetical protein
MLLIMCFDLCESIFLLFRIFCTLCQIDINVFILKDIYLENWYRVAIHSTILGYRNYLFVILNWSIRVHNFNIFLCLPLQSLTNFCWIHFSNHHDNPTISILQTSTKVSILMSQIKALY